MIFTEENATFVITCAKLIESGRALNASSDDDQCPICFVQWGNFVEPSLCAVLSCGHACCAACLLRFRDACTTFDNGNNEESAIFGCVLCRLKLSIQLVDTIAGQVADKRLVASFHELSRKLPFSGSEFRALLVSLLAGKLEFDVSRVESALFNMVGMVEPTDEGFLSFEKKQEFYKTARAPALRLQEEYSRLRLLLLELNDTDSVEWREKKFELDELHKKLNNARRNAACDIFERINSSSGKMGAIIEYIEGGALSLSGVGSETRSSLVHVDFHGLHVGEAKERVDEFVMPILPALKKMIVITGRGVHSEAGGSVLKQALVKYFAELNVKCEEVRKNKGALLVCM